MKQVPNFEWCQVCGWRTDMCECSFSQEPPAPKDQGRKFDSDKPPIAFIPTEAIMEEAKAFGHGAKKYEAWNYTNGLAVTRTVSAALRHIFQFLDGENIDAESGASHLGCARAGLAMALDTLKNHPELDDRAKRTSSDRKERE